MPFAEMLKNFQSVHVRHRQVQNEKVGVCVLEDAQCLLSVGRFANHVEAIVETERHAKKGADVVRVVGQNRLDHDGLARDSAARRRRPPGSKSSSSADIKSDTSSWASANVRSID